jgi:hypothetical protein
MVVTFDPAQKNETWAKTNVQKRDLGKNLCPEEHFLFERPSSFQRRHL